MDRKCKTNKKVRFATEENVIHQIGMELICENIGLEEGSVSQSEQSEIIYVADRKGDQKRQHEESEEIIIEEEVNQSEAEANDLGVDAAEAQIASTEMVSSDEVLLPDAITPSIKLLVFNIILPTIDIFLDTVLLQKLFHLGYRGSGGVVTIVGKKWDPGSKSFSVKIRKVEARLGKFIQKTRKVGGET